MNRLFKKKPSQPIIVVSGLPRSGTSMMMKMLAAGGLPILTDSLRQADESNPKGYYEFERVKKLKENDTQWLSDAHGKAVKIISALLEYLPPEHNYKVLFMRREMGEILASQKKMLVHDGKPTDDVSDEKLAGIYQKHLAKVESWLAKQSNIAVLYISYNDLLATPQQHLPGILDFLNLHLDPDLMLQVIDPSLYRQRQWSSKRSSL